MCFIESTLTAIINEPSLLKLLSNRVRLSFWIRMCGEVSSKSYFSSSSHSQLSSTHNACSMSQNLMHQVVRCDSSGHASIISRSFKPGHRMLAEGLQALLSSSIEASSIFQSCMDKLWRLGFAEFRSLDRLARAGREVSKTSGAFVRAWDSSMGHATRLLQNMMTSSSVLLQRSALSSQKAKSTTLQAIVVPAMSSTNWLNDIDQIISVAPLPMTRGLQQAAATLLSCVVQHISHVSDVIRDERIAQLLRNGTMVKLQVRSKPSIVQFSCMRDF